MAHLASNVNNIQSQMATKLEMSHLTSKISIMDREINARFNVLEANMISRLEKFENRFLFRMLFTVSVFVFAMHCFLIIIKVISVAVAASYLRIQAPASFTPTIMNSATQPVAAQPVAA